MKSRYVGFTLEAGTAYHSGAHEFTHLIVVVHHDDLTKSLFLHILGQIFSLSILIDYPFAFHVLVSSIVC
jgi:hypothetical protein